MQTIGLIAAMAEESQALLRYVRQWECGSLEGLRSYTFSITGTQCVLVTSGMGTRRAREAARSLVETYSPHRLVSLGIAGAVEPDLEIGDVILVEQVFRLDQAGLVPGTPLIAWPEAANQAVEQALIERGAHVYRGLAITTSGSQAVGTLLGGMKHPVLEMETYGIAQVAAEKGMPLLAIRAISDGPCAPIPFDLGEVMDEDANLRVGKLLGAIVHNPKIISQSRQMMRNNRIAAENAAIALLAALSQADFGKIQ